jgi:hypothetical protein
VAVAAAAAAVPLTLAAAPGVADHDPPPGYFAPSGASERLKAAHAAFLEGDYRTMTLALKDVLSVEDGDRDERANALALLERAYAALGRQPMPADWTLPAGVGALKIGVRRKEKPDGVFYNLHVSGDQAALGTVTQVQLVRFPRQVVLDRGAGLGEWEEDAAPAVGNEPPDITWSLSSDNAREPPGDGLYELTLKLRDGATTAGWVILGNLIATASPHVLAPSPGATVRASGLTARWRPFRSPELRPFERRGFSIGVYATDLGRDWEPLWRRWSKEPETSSLEMGKGADGTVVPITPGRRALTVLYRETRQFGPVQLRREASTLVPFTVAP